VELMETLHFSNRFFVENSLFISLLLLEVELMETCFEAGVPWDFLIGIASIIGSGINGNKRVVDSSLFTNFD